MLIARLEPGSIHHSTLAAGNPIFAGGEARLLEGRILSISNQSGHYFPNTSSLMVRYLLSKQVNLLPIELINLGTRPEYFKGTAWEFAKISGEKAYHQYLGLMRDRSAFEKEIAGVQELHLPLLYQDTLVYPIHIAAKAPCSDEVMDFLLDCGCNPNQKTSRGETPLGLLCEANPPNLVLIEKLLKAGADVDMLHGPASLSPLEIAKDRPSLHQLLENYRNKVSSSESVATHQEIFKLSFAPEREYDEDHLILKNSQGLLFGTSGERIPFIYKNNGELYPSLTRLDGEDVALASGKMSLSAILKLPLTTTADMNQDSSLKAFSSIPILSDIM